MRFARLMLLLMSASWPIVGVAQDRAEIMHIAGALVGVCIDGGSTGALSEGANLSLKSYDRSSSLKGQFKIKESDAQDLLNDLDELRIVVPADQVNTVNACLQPIRAELTTETKFQEILAALDKLEERSVAFDPPDRATIGKPQTVQARFSLSKPRDLTARLGESERKLIGSLLVDYKVAGSLDGGGAFDVSPPGRQVQFITYTDTAVWTWTVTPKQAGAQFLKMTFDSVLVIGGREGTRTTNNQSRQINVVKDVTPDSVAVDGREGSQTANNLSRQNNVVGAIPWEWLDWKLLWTVILVPIGAYALHLWKSRRGHQPLRSDGSPQKLRPADPQNGLDSPAPWSRPLTKTIFLASSSELKEDRTELEIFISRKNKDLVQKGVFLEMIMWEDFLDAMSQTRLQDEYNKAIRGCDIFVMLFSTKVGLYTKEEFETAFGQFKATKKPLIYTYFKDAATSTGSLDRGDTRSLWAFQDKLERLGHFYTVYKNLDDLKFKFDQQLTKFAENYVYTQQMSDHVPEEKLRPISRNVKRLEQAICEKVEAEVKVAVREAGSAPKSQEHVAAIESNIKRELFQRYAVFSKSMDIEIDYFLMPLLTKIVKIETKLRSEHRVPFTERRIAELRERLREIVMDNRSYLAYAGYRDAIEHVVGFQGHVADYIEKELAETRVKFERGTPHGIFALTDELLQQASADAKLAASL
jgi:hypothetical protein